MRSNFSSIVESKSGAISIAYMKKVWHHYLQLLAMFMYCFAHQSDGLVYLFRCLLSESDFYIQGI